MKRNLFDHAIYDDINVTPLLDLAWTLLVVFIIAITAAIQGIQVNLPKASAAPTLEKPSTKAVTVTEDGNIFLDAYPVSMQQLEDMLSQYKAADPGLPVVVKGDARISYQQVIDILDLCQRLEINHIGLVTQRLVK